MPVPCPTLDDRCSGAQGGTERGRGVENFTQHAKLQLLAPGGTVAWSSTEPPGSSTSYRDIVVLADQTIVAAYAETDWQAMSTIWSLRAFRATRARARRRT